LAVAGTAGEAQDNTRGRVEGHVTREAQAPAEDEKEDHKGQGNDEQLATRELHLIWTEKFLGFKNLGPKYVKWSV